MDIENQEQTLEIEVTDYLLLKAADLEKKKEDAEKDLLDRVKQENRNEEEELKKVNELIKIERILRYYELLISCADQILESLIQNNKKITDPVEEDFLYGGMILEEMENEGKETFKGILKKYEMNTDMDENIKKAIKTKFDGAEKIEPKDVADFLKKFQKKFGDKEG